MFFFLFALWIIFNGKVSVETVLLGLLFSGAIFAFACRFMGYSVAKEKKLFRISGLFLQYIGVLIVEIVKATLGACAFIVSPSKHPDPVLCKFETDLKSEALRVILANSITLTPGTITVSLDGCRYTVHCLDKSMAQGMDESSFVKILRRMEEAM